MAEKTFDRETLLDLTVNVIPLFIILFFVVAFAVVNPFGWDGLISTLQFGILIVTFGLLTVLTYYAGKAISSAEKEHGVEADGMATEPVESDEDAAD